MNGEKLYVGDIDLKIDGSCCAIYPGVMLMCGKVTHKNLIDSSSLSPPNIDSCENACYTIIQIVADTLSPDVLIRHSKINRRYGAVMRYKVNF